MRDHHRGQQLTIQERLVVAFMLQRGEVRMRDIVEYLYGGCVKGGPDKPEQAIRTCMTYIRRKGVPVVCVSRHQYGQSVFALADEAKARQALGVEQ